jgi:hypothetical protein
MMPVRIRSMSSVWMRPAAGTGSAVTVSVPRGRLRSGFDDATMGDSLTPAPERRISLDGYLPQPARAVL